VCTEKAIFNLLSYESTAGHRDRQTVERNVTSVK